MEDPENKENRHIFSWFEDRPRVNSRREKPKKKTSLLWKVFSSFTITFIIGTYVNGSFFENTGAKALQIIIAAFAVYIWTQIENDAS